MIPGFNIKFFEGDHTVTSISLQPGDHVQLHAVPSDIDTQNFAPLTVSELSRARLKQLGSPLIAACHFVFPNGLGFNAPFHGIAREDDNDFREFEDRD